MDGGKKEFPSLTLVEEDYFETGESTDGESEELDELILRAENSQHLWLNSDSDDYPTDVGLLQKKLQQKDEGLHLTAKIGKKLLLNTNRLTNQNQELKSQVLDLKEELTQLKYLQSGRGRSFQYYEGSDDDELDEGTCCRNHSISPNSNSSSIRKISNVLDETFSLRYQIEQLQLNNSLLGEELKTLQQQAVDEMDQLKEHYNQEFFNTKKLIGSLEKRIEAGEYRFARFECETKTWKESVEALAQKCNLHECEIDELQDEISSIKLDQKEEKNAIQQLVRENKELKELVCDLRSRVQHMEQISRPKVLRHVIDSSSPYVDSKSFTQELEQDRVEERRICNTPPSLFLPSARFVCPSENFFQRMSDFFGASSALKLGQPGRPGSSDLNLAVLGLNLREPCLMSKSTVSWFTYQLQFMETLFLRNIAGGNRRSVEPGFYPKISAGRDVEEKDVVHDFGWSALCRSPFESLCSNKKLPTTFESPTSTSLDLMPSNTRTPTVCSSRFLQNWFALGTPDLTTIFRKQSGVWIKGASVSDIFIEENFANIGLEAEEDDYRPTLSSTPHVNFNSMNGQHGAAECKQNLQKSKPHFKVKTRSCVETHKSLEDIVKCSYDKGLPSLKSTSLNDMSRKLHQLPMGLGCLWGSMDSPCSGKRLEFDDDFVPSLKIVRTSER